jgi:hypothetical protein
MLQGFLIVHKKMVVLSIFIFATYYDEHYNTAMKVINAEPPMPIFLLKCCYVVSTGMSKPSR